MTDIVRESKTTIFFQINFLIAANIDLARKKSLDFQTILLDSGLDLPAGQSSADRIALSRKDPSPLNINIDRPNPQLTSFTVTAQNPAGDIDMFKHEAQSAASAFVRTWPCRTPAQLIRSGVKIRHIYSCNTHAFKYIWEKRLAQSPADFTALGRRPVAGGGIRLVIPPVETPDQRPASIELRVESFMPEANRLFIETAFVWPKPASFTSESDLDIPARLDETESYAANEVWQFLTNNQ
jgi:hypothetical protein